MSAVLIAFPIARIVRTEAQRVERGPIIQALSKPAPERTYPPAWEGQDQHLFDHFHDTCGYSVEESVRRVGDAIHLTRQIAGENDDQRALRMAREAFAGLSPANRKP